ERLLPRRHDDFTRAGRHLDLLDALGRAEHDAEPRELSIADLDAVRLRERGRRDERERKHVQPAGGAMYGSHGISPTAWLYAAIARPRSTARRSASRLAA